MEMIQQWPTLKIIESEKGAHEWFDLSHKKVIKISINVRIVDNPIFSNEPK